MNNYLLKKGCILKISEIPIRITQDVVIETNTDLRILEDDLSLDEQEKIYVIENDKITNSLANILGK